MNTSYTIPYCALNDFDDDCAVVFQQDERNIKWRKEENAIENPNLWIKDTVSHKFKVNGSVNLLKTKRKSALYKESAVLPSKRFPPRL